MLNFEYKVGQLPIFSSWFRIHSQFWQNMFKTPVFGSLRQSQYKHRKVAACEVTIKDVNQFCCTLLLENVLPVYDHPMIQNWRWRYNFPRKVSTDFSQIRGSREKRKWTCVFSESWPSKKPNSVVVFSYFLFWSLWSRVIWTLTC